MRVPLCERAEASLLWRWTEQTGKRRRDAKLGKEALLATNTTTRSETTVRGRRSWVFALMLVIDAEQGPDRPAGYFLARPFMPWAMISRWPQLKLRSNTNSGGLDLETDPTGRLGDKDCTCQR